MTPPRAMGATARWVAAWSLPCLLAALLLTWTAGRWSAVLFAQALLLVLTLAGLHAWVRAWTPRLGPATARAAVALALALGATAAYLVAGSVSGSVSLEDASYWALVAPSMVLLETLLALAGAALARTWRSLRRLVARQRERQPQEAQERTLRPSPHGEQ